MQHATHITLREAALRGAGNSPVRNSAAPPPRRGLFRAVQTAAALALVALAGVGSTTAFTGCGGEDPPPFCDGGFVRKAPTETDPGVCEGKCTPEACGPHQACVDNHCVLTCASHLDCQPLTQDCVTGLIEDDTKKELSTCQPNGMGTIGVKCPFGDECNGKFACPDGKACDPACAGADCPCAAVDCKPLVCRSSGAGDAEAFCTLQDCKEDAHCPGGYWCATVRAPQEICNSSPKKGDSEFCGGPNSDPCVDPAQSAANGTTFVEGPHCALRNECRIRRQCAPCENDFDCSAIPGQRCKQVGPAKACVRDCLTEADCEQGFGCTDGSCVPRTGTCVGNGSYCQPCLNDNDCGGPTSNLSCVSFGGAERICIDVTLSMSCTSDNDCPVGPDGRHGLCTDETVGAGPGDAAYHKCYLPPFNEATNAFSCWGGNAGTGCYVGSDCISNKCVGASKANSIAGRCCVPSGTACRANGECCTNKCNGADVTTGTLGACQ